MDVRVIVVYPSTFILQHFILNMAIPSILSSPVVYAINATHFTLLPTRFVVKLAWKIRVNSNIGYSTGLIFCHNIPVTV